jgi:hypothetical protein
MAILIAIITHDFEAHLAAPRSRWNIERARIIMQVHLFRAIDYFLYVNDYPSCSMYDSDRI